MNTRLTDEMLRRECVRLIQEKTGLGLEEVNVHTRLMSTYDSVKDEFRIRVDFKNVKAFDRVPSTFLTLSLDDASVKLKEIVDALPKTPNT